MRDQSFQTIILFVFVPVMIFFSGQASDVADVENTATEIRKLWNQFIENWEAEDAVACASIYHANGLNIPNEFQVNSGVTEIEEFYDFLFANNLPSRYRQKWKSCISMVI